MASRSLWLGFGKAKKKIELSLLKDDHLEDKFAAMFEPFPFASYDPEPLLEVPYNPRMNTFDGLARKLSFDQALAWGDGIDNESSIFFPAFYIDGEDQQTLFCAKVLFNTEKVKPDDNCNQAIQKMLADANFYGHHLCGTLLGHWYRGIMGCGVRKLANGAARFYAV